MLRESLMNPRAVELIATLNLQPHPEGGCYREIFRSAHEVQPTDDRPHRAALTEIYFLLRAGEVSRLHRVASDEIWHFYEGASLDLFWLSDDGVHLHEARLGSVTEGREPVAVVPSGSWQAAVSTGEYTLVGCSVAPGFDFADFELIETSSPSARAMVQRHPALERFL